jgi:hypothetical protein
MLDQRRKLLLLALGILLIFLIVYSDKHIHTKLFKIVHFFDNSNQSKTVCNQISLVQKYYKKAAWAYWQGGGKDESFVLYDKAIDQEICFSEAKNSAVVVSVYDEYPGWVLQMDSDVHVYFHNYTYGSKFTTHGRSRKSSPKAELQRKPGDEARLKRYGVSVHKLPNMGDEALAYLAFIVENYHDLPDITAFVHADQRSTHHYSTLDGILRCVCIDQSVGYQSLNLLNTQRNVTDMHSYGHLCENPGQRLDFVRAVWKRLPFLKLHLGEIGKLPSFPMDTNAQFLLTRGRILAKLRVFYEQMLASTIHVTTWEPFWRAIFSSGSDCNGKWIYF